MNPPFSDSLGDELVSRTSFSAHAESGGAVGDSDASSLAEINTPIGEMMSWLGVQVESEGLIL